MFKIQTTKARLTMSKILMAVGLLFFAGCTNPESATRVLDGAGYKNIKITGSKFFACGKGDLFHTGFRAIGPSGKSVQGTVCEELLFKNSTIRFE